MGMVLCKCDHVISDVVGPCLDALRLVSEEKLETLYGAKVESSDDIVSEIFLRTTHVLKCPKCGRLLVFWDRKQATFYLPESADDGSTEEGSLSEENPK